MLRMALQNPVPRPGLRFSYRIREHGRIEGIIWTIPIDVVDAKSLLLFAVQTIGCAALLASTAGISYFM